MPLSSCRARFLLHRPCYTLVRWMLGMRIIWRLLAPFAFRVYPLRLYASYVRLQPPWPTVDCRLCKLSLQLVSSVGLYNMFLQHRAFLLGAGFFVIYPRKISSAWDFQDFINYSVFCPCTSLSAHTCEHVLMSMPQMFWIRCRQVKVTLLYVH